jgi:hypothetical protein
LLLLEELNCAIWMIATGVGVGGIRRMRKGKNCGRRKAGTDGVD